MFAASVGQLVQKSIIDFPCLSKISSIGWECARHQCQKEQEKIYADKAESLGKG